MKLRLKYLSFLALFLTGAFLIVTWKAYDIFSQKYAQTYQNMQIQDLEKQAVVVQSQFENLQGLLRAQDNVEPLLKAQNISLLAHIIKEDGKWKAQWFEGQKGLRTQAQGLAQQIPFDSLSTSKKSWHFVNIKDHGKHLAYVIPVFEEGKVNYYSFFFKTDFFSKWFKSASMAENLTLISPQVGEIYSLGEKNIEGLDQHKDILAKKQTGLWPVTKQTAILSYFHPDLQLLFVKNIHLQNLVVESTSYLWALFAMIGFLVMMALVALDLLFRGLFQRLSLLTQEVRLNQKTLSMDKNHFADELVELETRIDHWLHQTAPSADAEKSAIINPAAEVSSETTKNAQVAQEFSTELRSKAINCLGHLHLLKQQGKEASPQMLMLEKELRELRTMVDKSTSELSIAESSASVAKPAQPSFNPLVPTNARIHHELLPSDTISNDMDVQSLLMSIRKPKRESHESQKV